MLVFNGFRSPSIGLEYRCDGVGLHAGLYPTVISKGADGAYETSWFVKVGATAYPLPVVLYGKRPSSLFFSLSYAYGFDNRWRHSLLADAGIRWAAVAGLEMRLGAALLIPPTGPPRINRTPGINYAVAFEERRSADLSCKLVSLNVSPPYCC